VASFLQAELKDQLIDLANARRFGSLEELVLVFQDLYIFHATLHNTGNVPPVNASDGTYGQHYAPPEIRQNHKVCV
jgi:hypothetical protein